MHVLTVSRSRVKLRTRDDQPDQFPLLQECYEDVSEDTEAAINQQIEQLERDTIIARTQHRWWLRYFNVGYYGPVGRAVETESCVYMSLLFFFL